MNLFKAILMVVTLLLALASAETNADWHGGKVTMMSIGYDGKTIAFKVAGWTRNNCTCNPTWPEQMCLDSTRATYDFEKAVLLSARARGSELSANIEESSCKVVALYEIN